MNRVPVIAGNWKMYKTAHEAREYFREFIPLVGKAPSRVFLAVPFTAVSAAVEAAKGSSVWIGAQNMHEAEEGAFTGEVSALMLKDAGVKFVLIGHSERRHLFHETNAAIHKKIKRALQHKLMPVLCVGELQEERDQGKTEKVLTHQLEEGLKDLSGDEVKRLALAYEPVWAIGTGKTATPEMAQEVHEICRAFLAQKWGKGIADQICILYGGSVKPENIDELMRQPDIDGALVGGASLNPQNFAKIVNYKS